MASQPARQRKKEETAQRLFDTAVRLFLEQGYEETTVEQISAAAGVAKGTFFVHFPSKEAVLAHLGQMQMARVSQLASSDPAFAALDIRGQLRRLFRALAAGIEGQRELVRLVAIQLIRQQSFYQANPQDIDAFEELLARLMEAAQARGELRRDASPRELATLVRGVYVTAVLAWVQQGEGSFAGLAEWHLDLLLEGLLPGRHD